MTVINGRNGAIMPAFGLQMSPDEVWQEHADAQLHGPLRVRLHLAVALLFGMAVASAHADDDSLVGPA